MIKRILVPLDGSGLAERALPLAWGIASRTSADLLLLSAVVPNEQWAGLATTEPADATERQAAEAYLESVAEPLRTHRLKVRTLAVNDRAAHAICAAADAGGCDLIVMATHGRSGLGSWFAGSVAERVRHTTDTPVLLVHARRETVPQATKIGRILVPLDGSETAEEALGLAEELARGLEASLLLAQIVPSPVALYPDEHSNQTLSSLPAIREAAKDYLEGFASSLRERGVEVKTSVAVGEPAAALLDIAGDMNADMIAMTTHGRSALRRFVMGSVADAVSRAVEMPCLIVRARKWSDGHPPGPTIDGDGTPVQASEPAEQAGN
jgi:nucleotide-binding universal stress UspA family protein